LAQKEKENKVKKEDRGKEKYGPGEREETGRKVRVTRNESRYVRKEERMEGQRENESIREHIRDWR
jgi:hypothetical protein